MRFKLSYKVLNNIALTV